MAEYGELKNLQAFLAYWNFTADRREQLSATGYTTTPRKATFWLKMAIWIG